MDILPFYSSCFRLAEATFPLIGRAFSAQWKHRFHSSETLILQNWLIIHCVFHIPFVKVFHGCSGSILPSAAKFSTKIKNNRPVSLDESLIFSGQNLIDDKIFRPFSFLSENICIFVAAICPIWMRGTWRCAERP